MTRTRRNDRNVAGERMANQLAAVGHQVENRSEVTSVHDTQVEAAREPTLAAGNDHGRNVIIGSRFVDRLGEIGDCLL